MGDMDALAQIKQRFTDHVANNLSQAPEQRAQPAEREEAPVLAQIKPEDTVGDTLAQIEEAPADELQAQETDQAEQPEEVAEVEEGSEGEGEEIDPDRLASLESENVELRGQMEEQDRKSADYLRKVNNLIESSTELKTHIDQLKREHEYTLNIAKEKLAQYSGIDIANVSLEQRQQLDQQYRQDAQALANEEARYRQFMANSQSTMENARKAEAEASLGVLQHHIPNWGEEAYRETRDHVVNKYGFSDDFVDGITDHKLMRAFYDLAKFEKNSKGGEKLIKPVGKQPKPPAPGRGTPVAQARNNKGRFADAKERLVQNPGNKTAFADWWRAKESM